MLEHEMIVGPVVAAFGGVTEQLPAMPGVVALTFALIGVVSFAIMRSIRRPRIVFPADSHIAHIVADTPAIQGCQSQPKTKEKEERERKRRK